MEEAHMWQHDTLERRKKTLFKFCHGKSGSAKDNLKGEIWLLLGWDAAI